MSALADVARLNTPRVVVARTAFFKYFTKDLFEINGCGDE
jgi:hypothetical protein